MLQIAKKNPVESIIARTVAGKFPDNDEIYTLLTLRDETQVEKLFQAARNLRQRHFSRKVFLYGFLYFNTFCRNDCLFCKYRRSNVRLTRYRKKKAEILESASRMADAGVHLIDLTMGEASGLYNETREESEKLIDLVNSIKQTLGIPIMVSPGAVADNVLKKLATSGADWYACYQETHNRTLFSRLRVEQDYDERMNKKYTAKNLGLLIEEGILTGVGDSYEDITNSISAMHHLDPDQVRVMTFVPQDGIPMYGAAESNYMRELIITSLFRLVFPKKLIPASLDVGGLNGLKHRLDAGANVITSLVLPDLGFSGVAHTSLDIQEARRTPQAILPVLQKCGLRPANLEDYRDWLNQCRPDSLKRESL